jgi:hypothetical protein
VLSEKEKKETASKNKDTFKDSVKKNELEINTNFPSSINNKNLGLKGHSIESNCGQYIMKEYMKNVKKSFLNVLFKMENDDSCVSCQNNNDNQVDPIDFDINVSKFKLFKSSTNNFNKHSFGKCK